MNMKNVKYMFAVLFLVSGAVYSLADDQLYNCEASKAYENADSLSVLLASELEEDGTLPLSLLCGKNSMKDVVDREKLRNYADGWKESYGEYTKDTCNRADYGQQVMSNLEPEERLKSSLSRWELYDKGTQKYIASITYGRSSRDPSKGHIVYLSVDEEYRRKKIGLKLVNKAIEDMRTNYNCGEISLISASGSEKFWEKLGAKREPGSFYKLVFPDPSSDLS
jgi:ribosomal protein S18 acetylase RimI-like enzyme